MNFKKILAMVLVVAMCFSMIPTYAFADGEEAGEPVEDVDTPTEGNDGAGEGGQEEGDEDPPCDHEYVARVVEPTCTTDGYTVYECSKCGASYEGAPVPGGHNFADGKCTVCEAEDPDYVPPHEHVLSKVEAKAATCGEAGNVAYYACECGAAFADENGETSLDDVFVPATGEHTYEKGVCTVCGAEDPDFVAPVAMVGEKEFTSFEEAAACAIENNEAVTLLADVADEYVLAEGAELRVNKGEFSLTVVAPEGFYVVEEQLRGPVLLKTARYVAQIGSDKYETLAAAIAAVPADGTETTITMLGNETISGNAGLTIAANKNIVLDLNGFTVKNAVNENKASQVFKNNGTLTIQDSSADETGLLTNGIEEGTQPGEWWSTPQYNYATNVITNSGTLNVVSGTIRQTAAGSICYAIDNNSTSYDAVVNISGGTVTDDYGTVIRQFCNSTTKKNTINISGGEVVTDGYAAIWTQLPGSNSASMKQAKLNITGGVVTGKTYAWYDYTYGDGWENVAYSFSGGQVNGYIYSYGVDGFITGGAFSEDPSDYVADGYEAVWKDDNYWHVYKVTNSPPVRSESNPNEYTFEHTVSDAGNNTISSQTVTVTIVGAAQGVQSAAATTPAQVIAENVISTSLGEVEIPANDNVVIEIEIVVKAAETDTRPSGVDVGQNTVLVEAHPEAIVTVNNGAPQSVELTNADLATGSSFTFGLPVDLPDGTIVMVKHYDHDGSPVGDPFRAVVSNHKVPVTVSSFSFFTIDQIAAEDGKVAVNLGPSDKGGTQYTTLAAAVADAVAGDTIALLAGVEESDITIDKDLTVDLNGFTLTIADGADAAFTLAKKNKTFTLKDSGTNGKIESSEANMYGVMISANGSFVMDSGAITLTGNGSCAIFVDNNGPNAVVTVNGGSVSANSKAIANNTSATINVTGGQLNAAVAVYNHSGNVNISGGVLTGTTYSVQMADGGLTTISGTANGRPVVGGALYANAANLITISAGEFEVDPSDYVATGFIAWATESATYAWQVVPSVTLTFDAGAGATVDGTNRTVSFAVAKDHSFASAPASLGYEVPEPTKTAAVFDGWYYNGTGFDKNEPIPATVTYTAEWTEAVAQTGGVNYPTLEAAIAAVSDGGTITMIADVTNARGIAVESGKNFTLDFNGHTYSLLGPGAGSTGTETNGFQLKKDSTITFKNGTLNYAQGSIGVKRMIQNYANLTLEDMTISAVGQDGGEDYVLSFNNGDVHLTGSTKVITSDPNTVAFDVYEWHSSYPDGSHVTIDGNVEINGAVEFDNSGYTDGTSSLTVSGTPSIGKIVEANGSVTNGGQVAVSGGSFSEQLKPEYCAPGYVPSEAKLDDHGNTYYTVDPAWVVVFQVDGNEIASVSVPKSPEQPLDPDSIPVATKTGYTFTDTWKWGNTVFDPTVNITHNYYLNAIFTEDSTVAWTITDADEQNQVVYTGNPVQVSATVTLTSGAANPGTKTIEFKAKTDPDSDYTTTAPSIVGAYTARVTVPADTTAGYTAVSDTVDFSIVQAAFNPTVTLAGFVAGNTPDAPDVSNNPSTGAVTFAYKLSTATVYQEFNIAESKYPTTAGEYDLKASIAADPNYGAAEATTTFTVTAAVAKIGTTYYASLLDAINDAADGDEIVLMEDDSYTGTTQNAISIPANTTITIDLNGKNYELSYKRSSTLYSGQGRIRNNGTLTFTDSIGTGAYTGSFYNATGATLNIEDVTIHVKSGLTNAGTMTLDTVTVPDANGNVVAANGENAVTTIKDSTITESSGYSTTITATSGKTNTINIVDSTITNNTTYNIISVTSGTTLNISGCTLTGNKGIDAQYRDGSNTNVVIALDDTTITANKKSIQLGYETYDLDEDEPVHFKLTVKDSTLTSTTDQAICMQQGEVTINGTSELTAKDIAIMMWADTNLTINNGTITSTDGESAIQTHGNNPTSPGTSITINGGEINGGDVAIYHPDRGTLTVNGGTITGDTGIALKGGTLNISGGVISGTGEYTAPTHTSSGTTSTGDAVYVEDVYGASYKPTINITGGTLSSTNGYAAQYWTDGTATTATGSIAVSQTDTTTPILNSGEEPNAVNSSVIENKVEVSGGSFKAEVPVDECAEGLIPVELPDGRYSVGNGWKISFDKNSDAATGTMAVQTVAYTTAATSVSATLKANAFALVGQGFTGWNTKADGTGTGYADCAAVELSSDLTLYAQWDGAVAAVGTVVEGVFTPTAYFATLKGAVDAAEAGDTVQLLATSSSGNLIGITKNLTIDLNGYTYTRTGTGNTALYVHDTGTKLTIKDTSSSGAGKIAIHTNNEQAVAIRVYDNAELTLSGGKVEGDYAGIYLNNTSKATLSGGEVTGKFGVVPLDTSTLTVIDSAQVNTNTTGGAAISTNGNAGEGATVNIEGGSVYGGQEIGIYAPSGTLNISGGYISGTTAVYFKSTNLSITGGTLAANGEKHDYTPNGNGANATGDALVVDNCGYPNGLNSITVKGGYFESTNASPIASYSSGEDPTTHEPNTDVLFFVSAVKDEQGQIVSAPTFNKFLPPPFCAESFVPTGKDTSTNLFSVQRGWKLILDKDDGSGKLDYRYYAEGDTTQAPQDPTKAGYVFAGWYNGDTLFVFGNTLSSDVTLKAHWTSAVARIGDNYYVTLQDAVDAIGVGTAQAPVSGTIYLLDDITLTSKVQIPSANVTTDPSPYLSVTIEGDGHKIEGEFSNEFNEFFYGLSSPLRDNTGLTVKNTHFENINSNWVKGFVVTTEGTGTPTNNLHISFANCTFKNFHTPVYMNGAKQGVSIEGRSISITDCVYDDVNYAYTVDTSSGYVSGDWDGSGALQISEQLTLTLSGSTGYTAEREVFEKTQVDNLVYTTFAKAAADAAANNKTVSFIPNTSIADTDTFTLPANETLTIMGDGSNVTVLPAAGYTAASLNKVYDETNNTTTYSYADSVASVKHVDGGTTTVTNYPTLQGALNAAAAGDTVTLLDDYDATSAMYSGDTRFNLWIKESITLDLGGNTLTVKGRGVGVQGVSSNIDVTVKNGTITNVGNANGRCIDTRGNLSSLTLDSVTLTTNDSSYTGYLQPLTIGGNQATKATVVIRDSNIIVNDDANKGYAITTFNPVEMTITDSTIKGWANLNIKAADSSAGSAGSTITVNGSNLISANGTPGQTNAYSLIKIEDNNVTVGVTNSTISVNGGSNLQSIAAFQNLSQQPTTGVTVTLGVGNVVTMSGESQIGVSTSGEGSSFQITGGTFTMNGDDATFGENQNIQISGGTFNKEVPDDCCAEHYMPKDNGSGSYGVELCWVVTFDPAGGKIDGSTENHLVKVPRDPAQAIPAAEVPAPTKDNFVFKEWQLNGTAYDFDTVLTADIELDAVYTSAVASITKAGVTTYYVSLADAVAHAESGDTITMLANDDLSLKGGGILYLNKSLTITGPVDSNGAPLYTVFGQNDANGLNGLYIKTPDAVTVVISNVKFSEFGNNAATNSDHCVISVESACSSSTKLTLNNVTIEKYNKIAVWSGKGTLEMTGCSIDGAKSTDHGNVLTNGVQVYGSATITNCTIQNFGNTYSSWNAAGIQLDNSGEVTITGCTITSSEPKSIGVISTNDATVPASISTSTVTGAKRALYINTAASNGFVVNSGTYDGGISKFGTQNTCTINNGTFKNFEIGVGSTSVGPVINGGIFDSEPEPIYCAYDKDGSKLMPTPNTDPDTKDEFPYTVRATTLKWKETSFTISNEQELKDFRDLVNMGVTFEGQTATVTADIALTEAWTPIGEKGNDAKVFKGTFDGGSKTISNMIINDSTANYQALFGRIADPAIIENLTVSGSVTAVDAAGVVARMDGGILSYVTSKVTVNGSSKAGGVVCLTTGESVLYRCTNTGAVTVSGTNGAGGILGYANGGTTVSDSINRGAVTGGNNVGGIVGLYKSDANTSEGDGVDNCVNVGNVADTGTHGTTSRVGGIVGIVEANGTPTKAVSITNNKNVGEAQVSGYNYAGGIVGHTDTLVTVSGNENMGSVTCRALAGSGDVSYPAGVVSAVGANATVTVTGNTYKGALVSAQDGNIYPIVGVSNSATVNNNDALVDTLAEFSAAARDKAQLKYITLADNISGNYELTSAVSPIDVKKDSKTVNVVSETGAVIETLNTETGVTTYTLGEAVASITHSGVTTNYATLAAAVAAVQDGETIVMLKDASNTNISVNNGYSFTIDLNGHKTSGGYIDLYNGFIMVTDTAETKGEFGNLVYVNVGEDETKATGQYNSFTLATGATMANNVYVYQNDTAKGYGSKVTINGTMNGLIFVLGNIHEGNTVVDVYGTINSTDDVAIALNGCATVNVYDGAVITAADENGKGTGIEVRAGTLNVTGGTITGNGAPTNVTGNNSGTTSTGAAVAVSQHTTKLPITVKISGGTLTGYSAFYESNPEGNSAADLDKITLEITGGTFTTKEAGTKAVYSADKVKFISGGTFSDDQIKNTTGGDGLCVDTYYPKQNILGTYDVTVCTEHVDQNPADGHCDICGHAMGSLVKTSSSGNGSTTGSTVTFVSGGGVYYDGAQVTLTAHNANGYTFKGWYAKDDPDTKLWSTMEYTFTSVVGTDYDLVAVYDPIAGGMFHLTVIASKFTASCYQATQRSIMNVDLPANQDVTVKFTGSEKFLYWINDSDKVVSMNPEYSFTLSMNRSLRAVYSDASVTEDEALLVFVSTSGTNGQVFTSYYGNTSDPIAYPMAPSFTGKTFRFWTIDGVNEATEDVIKAKMATESRIVIYPLYADDGGTYSVTVKYTDGTTVLYTDTDTYKDVPTSNGVTLVADASHGGGNAFSYWTDNNGVVLSYDENYYFRPPTDTIVCAVFKGSQTAVPTVTMSGISASMGESGTYDTNIVSAWNVPTGYTLVATGMLYGYKTRITDPENEMRLDSEQLNVNVFRVDSSNPKANGTFTAHIERTKPTVTTIGRAFLTYKDGENHVETIYSTTWLYGSYKSLTQ